MLLDALGSHGIPEHVGCTTTDFTVDTIAIANA